MSKPWRIIPTPLPFVESWLVVHDDREILLGQVKLEDAEEAVAYLNALEAEKEELRRQLAEAQMFLRERVDYIRGFEEEACKTYSAAHEQVRALRVALLGLLDDTQHRSHDCREEDCPVRVAHDVLEATADQPS